MKQMTFTIPLYGIDVRLVQFAADDNSEEIRQCLSWGNLADDDVESITNEIRSYKKNGGDTWRNFDIRKVLVLFFPFSNEKECANVYGHEKRHIEDRVMEWASVDDIESAGLLAGFLSEKFYEFKNIQIIND